jgi:hypothetical protein
MRLAAIAIYPVKACRATQLQQATLGRHGLAGDREWMVIRPDGRFLSQRSHPLLARVVPTLTPAGLRLACEAREVLSVDRDAVLAGAPLEVRVWDDTLAACDAGDVAADWVSAAIGTPARLVRVADRHGRCADRDYVGEHEVPVAFADGFPLLVCSASSLAVLNDRLPVPVPMERFRPNLVLEGLPAFAEDGIRLLRIGSITLTLVKPCARCSVPGIDQLTGQPSTDPFAALKAFRYDPSVRGATFGVNAIAEGPPGARLEVGMTVTPGD